MIWLLVVVTYICVIGFDFGPLFEAIMIVIMSIQLWHYREGGEVDDPKL